MNIADAFKNNQLTPREKRRMPLSPENSKTSRTIKAKKIHSIRILL
jgi:hypothetical protein